MMRRVTPFVLAAIFSVICASTARAQCTGPTLPAICSFSAAGVTSTSPTITTLKPNEPLALVGTMTFNASGCSATEMYFSNFNGSLGGTGSTPVTGTYTMTSSGIGEVSFSNGDAWQIAVDTPGSTTGTETEVRLLFNAPDTSGGTTSSIILVGTCKTQ